MDGGVEEKEREGILHSTQVLEKKQEINTPKARHQCAINTGTERVGDQPPTQESNWKPEVKTPSNVWFVWGGGGMGMAQMKTTADLSSCDLLAQNEEGSLM